MAYLAAGLTGAAVARAVVHLVSGWPVPRDDIGQVLEHHPDEPFARTPRTLIVVPAMLLLLGLVVPLLPGVLAGAGQAGAAFVDAAGYRAAVVGDAPPPPPEPAELEPFKTDTVLETLGVTLAGLVLGGTVARWWRHEQRGSTAPLRWLRRAHTGLVNDQMTWLTAATAGWCLVVLVRLTA